MTRPDPDPKERRATYRLQLHQGFGFKEAAAQLGYLARLGVSHVYSSPYLQAAAGSAHGYDVVDHHSVNEELGGRPGHRLFNEALKEHGLGQLLDIVPNHMSVADRRNRWWWDVLENGPLSRYAGYFDVDWDPPEAKLRDLVLLPILDDHYGRVLARRQLRLEREGGTFTVCYGDRVLPVAPPSLAPLLERAALRSGSAELGFLASASAQLPGPQAAGREPLWRRHRDKEVIRLRLGDLGEQDPSVAEAIDLEVAALNEDPGALDELLEAQNYRLARWQVAGQELDYRRFFDIDSLAAIRVEDEQVFAEVHELVLGWLRAGLLDGLRIDHVDGLRDPGGYLERLRREAGEGAWLVVEKVLAKDERLPSWPVAGTTGYDFLNQLTGLFVDPAGERPLSDLHHSFTGSEQTFEEVCYQRKRLISTELLASDFKRLTELLVQICEKSRSHRDYTRRELEEAVRELACGLDVYRTYVQPEHGQLSAEDRRWIEAAVSRAKAARPDIEAELLDFVASLLLLKRRGPLETELVMRFQQASGPVMAKAVEDSAFYAYNRLVALNEVGGDPSRFGTSLKAFHEARAQDLLSFPQGLLATSTHDTKRSEDVRARLCLISEIPQRWASAVAEWGRLNDRWRNKDVPDPEMELLLYQVLVGAHSLDATRACAYMEKASKEARIRTSWTSPDGDYDRALREFVRAVVEDGEFQASLSRFAAPLIEPGRVNSLAMKLITLTSPGVADVYQGTELWDLSLVDPDNRRPVDFELRGRLLEEVLEIGPEQAWARQDEGLPKLLVVQRALDLRRRRPELFGPNAGYRPLPTRGEACSHLVAFARGEEALVVTPRLVLGLAGHWDMAEVEIPPGAWRNQLTQDRHEQGWSSLAELCARFPVALLEREPK